MIFDETILEITMKNKVEKQVIFIDEEEERDKLI